MNTGYNVHTGNRHLGRIFWSVGVPMCCVWTAENTQDKCVVVCCSVLQCAAVCCSVLQCVAVCVCVDHNANTGNKRLGCIFGV